MLVFRTLVFGTSSSPLSEMFLSSFSYSHFFAVFKGLPFVIFFLTNPSSTCDFPAIMSELLLSWVGLGFYLFCDIWLLDVLSKRWLMRSSGFSWGIAFFRRLVPWGKLYWILSLITFFVGWAEPVVLLRLGFWFTNISSIVSDISLRILTIWMGWIGWLSMEF